MPNAGLPFAVMAKPVGSSCNMNCSYCYYLHNTEGGAQGRMSDEVLEAYIRSYMTTCPGNVCSFTWHGGEPTLASLSFYKRAVEFQHKYLRPGQEVWNNLQTNGQDLDGEWLGFLKDQHFDIGLSIDGTKEVHDTFRKDTRGLPTWENARNTVKKLMDIGIRPDLLCTVTSMTAGKARETYRALRDMGTGWMQFIPIVRYMPDGTLTEDSVTPDMYGDFLINVFDEWLYEDMGRTQVQFFMEIISVLMGGAASLCTMMPVCGRVLVVEKDGGIYSCDHFVDKDHRLGNVLTDSLKDAADSEVQLSFGSMKKKGLTGYCRSCRYLRFCRGGCLKDRTAVSPRGESGHYLLCSGLRRFFDHAIPPLSYMVNRNREGAPPERIMRELLEKYKDR